MARAEGLFARLVERENVWRAWLDARRGKARRPDVARFARHATAEVDRLAAALAAEAWRPGGYRRFIIRRPKPRLIAAAPFRDRVVHHAIHRVLAPVLTRRFASESYACLPGKGTHRAVLRFQAGLRHHRAVVRLDVRRYFLEIDWAVLMAIIARSVNDPPLMRLLAQVLDSGRHLYRDPTTLSSLGLLDDYAPAPDKGLPIGNLTSQLFANLYLDAIDHRIKRRHRAPAYVRYMDDLAIFGDDRARLREQAADVIEWLGRERRLTLRVKGGGPLSTRHAHTFLGYTVTRDARRVARRTVRRVRGRLKHAVRSGAAGDMEQHAAIAEQTRAIIKGLVF